MAKTNNANTTTSSSTQTVGAVVYDVTTIRDSNGRVIGGSATPR